MHLYEVHERNACGVGHVSLSVRLSSCQLDNQGNSGNHFNQGKYSNHTIRGNQRNDGSQGDQGNHRNQGNQGISKASMVTLF
jgi:hypothetical protein